MHASGSELLMEAIPESLKNMLLVMETAGVFDPPSDGTVQDVSFQTLQTLGRWVVMNDYIGHNFEDDLFGN